jgi:succinyl-CoA synthetase beta subunit
MLLIEVDGKALFAAHGIAVPAGIVVTGATAVALPGDGP